jgi:hypothetical protein
MLRDDPAQLSSQSIWGMGRFIWCSTSYAIPPKEYTDGRGRFSQNRMAKLTSYRQNLPVQVIHVLEIALAVLLMEWPTLLFIA